MAAGLGFKDFTTGEVLTAADVDGYLMQGIWVFANATARDAAVTSPQEGNFAFLKDTNTTTYYTGSAWTNLDTTGMVNPMTTTGDTIYSSSGSTPARLGIGSTGQILTVAGGVPSWATPAGGGANFTLLNAGGTTLSGSSTVTVSGISGADKILVLVDSATSGTAGIYFNLRLNTDTGNNYAQFGVFGVARTSYSVADVYKETSDFSQNVIRLGSTSLNNTSQLSSYIYLTGCNSSGLKVFQQSGTSSPSGGTNQEAWITGGYYNSASTISSISINAANNFTGGSVYVYTSA